MLKHIFRILKEYFPTNIKYWSNVNEARVLKLVDSGLYTLDPNALIPKEIFYEQAKKAFSKNIIDKDDCNTLFDKKAFLKGRELFIKILHVTIEAIPRLTYFPPTPMFDPELPRLSRPSAKISSAKQNSCPTHHVTIDDVPTFPPKAINPRPYAALPYAKISSAEQKAKTWVVKENKEKPWNMQKVLEELGEVRT